MPSKTRTFPLGVVLSVTTERLLAPIGAVYDVLGFLTGETLWTHQLPRANEVCRPHVLAQHPHLTDVDASSVTPDNWRAWLDNQEARFGAALVLRPLPTPAEPQFDTPVADLIEMRGGNTSGIIVMDATSEDADAR